MSVVASTDAPVNRSMIICSVMLATIMTAIDTTIANVALPHMAGSMSASADQITWVLTSYIVAMAIVTPMSGWLAGRFGRKRVFMVSIIGFTVASALCGAAQSLEQIVLFRVLQGACGATLAPLSQAVILDAYPIEERGPAMAVWSMGMIVAPIAGPVLGGWLTDDLNWRWVFYINLPVGALAVLGVMSFIPDARTERRAAFDIAGFALLSVVLIAVQLVLDRGPSADWFQSREIVIEASVAVVALILFLIHTMAAAHPFMPIALLGDRNLVATTILGMAVGVVVFAAMALLPPMTQNLLGYPVATAGVVMAPRGIGAMISTYFAGRLIGKADDRMLIVMGLGMFAVAFEAMSHFSLQMSANAISTAGFIQGLGGGFIFVPMTTLAFATLAPSLRADGAGFATLIRNLGNSAGISITQAVFTRNVQVVHNRLVEGLTPDNPLARAPYLAAPYTLSDPVGLTTLNGEVTRQASMVAYVDVFHLLFLTTLLTAPLVLLLRKPGR